MVENCILERYSIEDRRYCMTMDVKGKTISILDFASSIQKHSAKICSWERSMFITDYFRYFCISCSRKHTKKTSRISYGIPSTNSPRVAIKKVFQKVLLLFLLFKDIVKDPSKYLYMNFLQNFSSDQLMDHCSKNKITVPYI